MNEGTYHRLKSIIQLETSDRFEYIQTEANKIGGDIRAYDIQSPRGVDRHISLNINNNNDSEVWFTANYDTFEKFPSANNNASGVITLLGMGNKIEKMDLPIDVRLFFLDAGLDQKLVAKKQRDNDFVPGSELLVSYMLNNEIEFIDKYTGTFVVQAVGKGNLCVFDKTGKKEVNSYNLNEKIVKYGQSINIPVEIQEKSPLADNISFLKQGLESTVIARYQEGSWHRMQTPKDDISNVNPKIIDETIEFLVNFLESYKVQK